MEGPEAWWKGGEKPGGKGFPGAGGELQAGGFQQPRGRARPGSSERKGPAGCGPGGHRVSVALVGARHCRW